MNSTLGPATVTITRASDDRYAVTTSTVLADGSLRCDSCCRLDGAVIRSHETAGDVRIGGLIRVVLGPRSLPRVLALAVGESVTL